VRAVPEYRERVVWVATDLGGQCPRLTGAKRKGVRTAAVCVCRRPAFARACETCPARAAYGRAGTEAFHGEQLALC
jgi:hypothetical protein